MVAATAQRRSFAPAPAWQARNIAIGQQYDWMSRLFAVACLMLLLLLEIAVSQIKVAGIPIHAFVSCALLMVLGALYARDAHIAVERHLLLLCLAAGLAFEGILVSLANNAAVGDIVDNVIQIHVQAIVTITVAAILARVCGPRACVFAIIAVVAITSSLAVLQMLHVDFAWHIRLAIGPLSRDENNPLVVDTRPTGLSYSPIHLTTEICLAFAAFGMLRDRQRRMRGDTAADLWVILAVFALIVGSIASQTRTGLLGAVLFLGLYAALKRSTWLPLLLLFGALVGLVAWPLVISIVQSTAPRVASVSDNSAVGRLVFAYYGVRLFLDNPLGYGLMFQPDQLWGKYWSDLYLMQAAQGAQIHDLHDYVLSMLNIYGIGIALFIPFAVKLLRQASWALVYFVPYAVHIMFHNSGPLYNDNIIWFVVAAFSSAGAMEWSSHGRPLPIARASRYPSAAARSSRLRSRARLISP